VNIADTEYKERDVRVLCGRATNEIDQERVKALRPWGLTCRIREDNCCQTDACGVRVC
jgi:hypothetical protein